MFCVLNFATEPPVPAEGQVNILAQADDQLVVGSLDPEVQPGRSDRAVLDQDQFMGQTWCEARRREEIRLKNLLIRSERLGSDLLRI